MKPKKKTTTLSGPLTTELILPALTIDAVVTKDRLLSLRKAYLKLAVKDDLDKPGYEACYAARREVQTIRVDLGKWAVNEKAPLKEHMRELDEMVAAAVEFLAPIEAHLRGQEDIVTNAAKRKEAEKALKLQERLERRQGRLKSINVHTVPAAEIVDMTDGEFDAFFAVRSSEAEARDKESKRLDAQRKAQEKTDREQRERNAELEREQKKIDDQKLKQKREADALLAQQKRAQQEKDDRDREEAERPMNERIRAFAKSVRDLQIPADFSVTKRAAIVSILCEASTQIGKLAR